MKAKFFHWAMPFALASLQTACGAPDESEHVDADGLALESPKRGLRVPTSPHDIDITSADEIMPPGAEPDGTGIQYHGGPIMHPEKKFFYIWYGDVGPETKAILRDFAKHIGGSDYFALNTLYYDEAKRHVLNKVTFAGEVGFGTYHGKYLSDAEIKDVVHDAIASGALPIEANAVYFVIAGNDVGAHEFCTTFCGWHTASYILTKNPTVVKYAFIGDLASCPSCEAQQTSPNHHPGADAMVSVIAHELEEAATDPELNAWYDQYGQENADKCAWRFPGAHRMPNGSKANIKLGDRHYLIQANWLNEGHGGCRMHLP